LQNPRNRLQLGVVLDDLSQRRPNHLAEPPRFLRRDAYRANATPEQRGPQIGRAQELQVLREIFEARAFVFGPVGDRRIPLHVADGDTTDQLFRGVVQEEEGGPVEFQSISRGHTRQHRVKDDVEIALSLDEVADGVEDSKVPHDPRVGRHGPGRPHCGAGMGGKPFEHFEVHVDAG
jgi:hypothetical protein